MQETMTQAITILIADDHKLIRETWIFLLNSDPRFQVIADTGNPDEVARLVLTHEPDVVLLDINMGPVDGFEVARQIQEIRPETQIIAITMFSQPAIAKKMMKTGASAYVTKQSGKDEMIRAILEVMEGHKYVCDEIRNLLAEQMMTEKAAPSFNDLSQRELEIVSYIKKGLSSKEIGIKLNIATKTIEVHRYNILKKLRLKNTAELINVAMQAGL
ncbi:MAG: response regulator transcription factor [Chitinophagaceae bacterium]|nr:response regulator transcription factor [Chitinophagaceae bacterium]